jgi:hypothetical protein
MASLGLSLPTVADSPDVSPDEAYERAFIAEVHRRQDEVLDRFCELLADHCLRRDGNPLAEMHELLSGPASAPILDLYDARQYREVGRPDDAALARLVRYCYAEANLSVAQAVRDQLADVAF